MGLTSSLNIAVGALDADQGAISVTSNNIANVNTPGYTREIAELQEADPISYGNLVLGNGVQLGQVQSQRNSILQLRLDQESQQQSSSNAYLNAMQQVQTLFNETSGTGLQSSISAFFNSLQQLSTDPSNTALRQGVMTAAQDMTQQFNQASSNLTNIQANLNLSVSQSVNQINALTAQIAQANTEVTTAQGLGENAGTFIDQRDQLVQQLSGLTDVSEITTNDGSVTLTTSSGIPLVVENQNFQLATQTNTSTGMQDVYSQGTDITSQITGGTLGGDIAARDQAIPSVLSSLDSIAAGIENSFNSAQTAGYDLNGNPGTNFFATPSASGAGAAAGMAVALTDPSQIAASATGAVGDNGNLNNMIAIQNQTVVNGQTPMNAYSNLIFQIGNDVSNAQSENQGAQLAVQQIQNQIGSVSGVSLDEEAANLALYQRSYQAMAQVASVVNDLMLAAINLGDSSTQS
jgi:flagellar hook-associated protein 1